MPPYVPPPVESDTAPSVLRGLVRLVAGLGAVVWAAVAIYLFARRVGPFRHFETCQTAGTGGTIWAIAESLVAFVGVMSALGFALDAWVLEGADHRRFADHALARAGIALVIWGGLIAITPHVHGC